MRRCRQLAALALCLAAVLAVATVSTAGAQAAQVEGFRSAKFGADEKAVRAAIKADFGIEAKSVRTEVNPLEKTTALLIEMPDLEPGGKAQIAYILGTARRS